MKKLENSRESIQSAHSFSQEECLFSQQTPLLQLSCFFRSLGSLPTHKVAEESFCCPLLLPAYSDVLWRGGSKKTALYSSPTTLEGDYHWKVTGWHIFVEAWWVSPPYCRSLTAQINQNITDTSEASALFWALGMQKDHQTLSVSISLLHAAIRIPAGQSQFPEQHVCSHATSLAPEVRCHCRGEEAEEHPKVHEKTRCSMAVRHNGSQELNVSVLSKGEIQA